MAFFTWVQETGIATFVRESPSFFGYPFFLTVHTLGLSVIVGVSTVVGVRLLGVASPIPVAPLARLFPIMWLGFAINTISGAGLWAADAVNKSVPGDARQAPVFLTKMLFVLLAVACVWALQKRFREPSVAEGGELRDGKVLAAAMLIFWFLAMIAGRLIAYSEPILTRL